MSAVSDALAVAVRHHQAGHLEQAIACYRRVLELQPNHADALANLGAALQQEGQLDEAAALFQQALAIKPDLADALNNLAVVFRRQEKFSEAAACCRRVVELRPQSDEANFNVAAALRALGQTDEAIDFYGRAIALRPDYVEAYSNLGNALKDRGRLEDAVASYRRAAELAPTYAIARNNLGAALQEQGQLAEAIAAYRRALELQPSLAVAHTNLGTALREQGDLDEAVACHHRAITLQPGYAEAHNHLGAVLKDQALLDEAICSFRRAIELNADFIAAHSNLLYTLPFSPAYDAAAIYAEHRHFDQQHAQPFTRFIQPHANERSPGRRLRVGYVSPDFCDHCQALFTTPLLSAHDHQQFEVFCYADVTRPDNVSERLCSFADQWRNIVGLPPADVANIIRHDQIDILVDLTMHMKRGHLLVFAYKPAAVQVCWLAYPGTTGLSAIDYRLTDPHLDPPAENGVRVYSEETFHLPETFWCYDPLTTEPEVNHLPALQNGHITFGSLNNFCKINAGVLQLWARVLKAVHRSQLILLADRGSHRQQALDVFAQEGVDPGRITFFSRQPRQKYLELYHAIDLGLDTFPYNGHTTSLDAYWMGVPVITLVGHTVVGRAGLSQLTNLGLPELIAQTADEYLRIVTDLAADLPRLSQLRTTLRARLQRSPLMDAPRFTRHLEAAYRAMWQRWCNGKDAAP